MHIEEGGGSKGFGQDIHPRDMIRVISKGVFQSRCIQISLKLELRLHARCNIPIPKDYWRTCNPLQTELLMRDIEWMAVN